MFFKVLLPFMIGLVACAGQPSSIITSTSPLPAGVRGSVPASGSNCQYSFLGLIPITRAPNTQEALADAKEDSGCDVLTDVTVDESSFYAILFSARCIYVRGLGVSKKDLSDSVKHPSSLEQRLLESNLVEPN